MNNALDEHRLLALLETVYAEDRELFERVTARLTRASNPRKKTGILALTTRERQIVDQALLGQTTKEIAYALGISDSTVRVLLSRAVRRVGVRNRRELLARAEGSTVTAWEPAAESSCPTADSAVRPGGSGAP